MKTEVFARSPGQDSIVDIINPQTGLSSIYSESLDEVRLRYPKAEITTLEAFCAAKALRQDCPIEWDEISKDRYHEMLNVLPPTEYGHRSFLVGEPWDHHALSGQPRYQAFKYNSKYFASSRPMTAKEFQAL